MLIENTSGQVCDSTSILARFEWRHIQTSARRHAREQEQRYAVIGERGLDGRWHYVITAKDSALHARHQLEQERQLLDKLREQERRELAETEEWLQRYCPHPGMFRSEQCYACGAVA